MKTMKKVLAFMLALAMVVTAVPVTNAEAATGLPKSKSYYAGKTYTLKLTTPSSWKSVSTVWSATNNNTKAVAISDKKAKSVTVKALKKGKAVVTAKVTYKKSGVKTTKTYKCNVRVKAPTIAITQKAITVEVDKTANITAKYVPASGIVSFESEDDNVAAVKDLGNGKAVVTGVTPGQSTNIKAYLRCGKKVKMSIVKVTVTGEKLADGLSAKLLNQFGDRENTVASFWGDPSTANLRVYYGKSGKGAVDKTIYTEFRLLDGTVLAASTSHVTDANGYAMFPVTRTDNVIVKYTSTVLATGEKIEGEINFAKIGLTNVEVANGVKGNYNYPYSGRNFIDEGYTALVPSVNDYKAGVATVPTTTTDGTYTSNTVNTVVDAAKRYTTTYVNSQQVSTATKDEHKVGFVGGLPYIMMPTRDSDKNQAVDFQQGVDVSSGVYHVYNNTKPTVITLTVNPNELTYARLNFSDLKLSPYTYMSIQCYKDEACTQAFGSETRVYGPHDQQDFAYQIPLQASDANKLSIKVAIVSKGQVDTAKSTGYVIKDITGVYKSRNETQYGAWETLDGAEVKWSVVKDVKYSNEMELTGAALTAIQAILADNGDLGNALGTNVAKVYYQVPVFPYTGNAVITTKDKNGKVLAYYACPTKNNGKNQNVLDTAAKFCYKISVEEAFNSVGDIVGYDGQVVTVNSEKAGTTVIVGEITGVPGLDATNSKVYTSVQWNPIKNSAAVVNNSAAIAFKGQNLEVTAQLIDKNGNFVSVPNKKITFKYGKPANADGTGAVTETVINKTDNVLRGTLNAVNPAVVAVPTETDPKGQAKLVLKAADVAILVGVTAVCDDGTFDVVIKVGDDAVKKVDLYWLNARPAFIPSAQKPDVIVASDSTLYDSAAGATDVLAGVEAGDWVDVYRNKAWVKDSIDGLNPEVGSKWEYGFILADEIIPKSDATHNYGILNNNTVKINDANIALNVAAGNVATVDLNTGINGMAVASSSKTGWTKLTGTVTGKAVDGKNVTFGVGNKTFASCGTGNALIDNKLTLNIEWGKAGQSAEFVNVNGYKASATSSGADEPTFDLFLKVTDLFGNADKDSVVTVKVDDSAFIYKLNDAEGISKSKADANGILKITVLRDTVKLKASTVVTATVDGIEGQQFVAVINWVTVTQPSVVKYTDATDTTVLTRATGNKIVIALDQNVIATSVDKSQFKVVYDTAGANAEVEVTNVEVSGNQIILTLAQDRAKDDVSKAYTVSYTADKKVAGVTTNITTVDGYGFEKDWALSVYAKETIPADASGALTMTFVNHQ